MVEICHEFSSGGRNLGNKLFTYGVSKIISDTYGYYLSVPEPAYIHRRGSVSLFPYKSNDGIKIKDPMNYVSDRSLSSKGIEEVIKDAEGKYTFMDGYFLKFDYIKDYKKKFQILYQDLILDKDDKNDIIILLRDSNNDGTFKLPKNYYLEVIKNLNFDNLYVSYDHLHKHQSLIDDLEKYQPILLDLPILDLFKTITSKKTIIASQGSFSFWACWLSNAEKIFWPITKIGPNAGNWSYNFTVDNEERYFMIDVEN